MWPRAYSAWNSGKAKDLSGIRVLSPYKIEFQLTQPVGYFLNLMALEAAAIGDPKVEQHYGYKDYLDHAVGTGPYMLAKWVHNRELDLQANPNYGGWAGPKPSIKYVDTVIGPSDSEQLQLFQKGQVDYYGGRGGGVSSSSYLEILGNQSLKKLYHRGIDVDVFYTGFHVNQPPFNNPVVRQAVNYAVNKQQLLAALTNGRGTLDNDGLYTPGLPGYQATAHDQYPYNPAKAAKLLASVGISPSHPVSTELVTYNAPHVLQQAEIIQADLKAVGINMSIKSMAVGPFLSYVSNNKNTYGLYNSSWGQDYPDPQDFFFYLFDKSQINGGSNNAGWTDPKFQALITRADSMPSTQEAQRIQLYREANQILVQQAPWVFMYYGWADALVQPWVHYSSPGNIGLGPVYPLEFNYLTLSSH